VHATTVDASRSPRSGRTRYVVAVIAGLVGLVWALQGAGAPIGRSFMIGDPLWILLGLALIAAAIAYAAWPRVRRR
jgi:hypothetical protein